MPNLVGDYSVLYVWTCVLQNLPVGLNDLKKSFCTVFARKQSSRVQNCEVWSPNITAASKATMSVYFFRITGHTCKRWVLYTHWTECILNQKSYKEFNHQKTSTKKINEHLHLVF